MGRPRNLVDQFFGYNVNLASRTIYMGPETDGEMAEYFLKAMSMLASSDAPIYIVMNNEGGDEYHGLAIYDAIATSKAHVTITVYGHAMSMGSWILQAADERVLSPRSTVMVHYGTWGRDDHFKYAHGHMKEGERLNKLMEETYLARIKQVKPKFTLAKLQKMLEDETYLTAQQAVELGLADRVLEEP